METRGILRPAALDQLLRLERRLTPADLAELIDAVVGRSPSEYAAEARA